MRAGSDEALFARMVPGGKSSPVAFVCDSSAGSRASGFEGAIHAFPKLSDLRGSKLADGEFVQWLEDDRLHVTITYSFRENRVVQETATFVQRPTLQQEAWSWREETLGRVNRSFAIDFQRQHASAEKLSGETVKRWAENLKIDPDRTFAGFGLRSL